MKKLGARVQEIKHLRNKQQEQRLAEMTQYTDDSKDHAREIAVCVAHEDFGGVPIMAQ